ncbi:hypothetical protein ACIF8T_40005 [Streptomyces sp. NPDC085946]
MAQGVHALITGGTWLAAAWREYRMHSEHGLHEYGSRSRWRPTPSARPVH